MNYKTKQEIKGQYKALNLVYKCQQEHPEYEWDDIVSGIKKEIRREYKRASKLAREFAACEHFVYYSEDGQTITEYRKYTTDMSREEMREWCEEYYKDNQVYSAYDCTGQRFVSSINFAHMRDNIYLVRITWGLDV